MQVFNWGCRKRGLHVAATGWSRRLLIVSARATDLQWNAALGSDAEAQQWLGWPDSVITAYDGPMFAEQTIRTHIGVLPPLSYHLDFTVIDASTYAIVGAFQIRGHDAHHEVGGVIRAQFRHRGYGTQALRTVCQLAHLSTG